MIRFDNVSFTYTGADHPTLRNVNLEIPEGELCVVVGETGTGKSTLLRAINGLVPHFTGGNLSGTVTVGGRSTRDHRPRDLADVVGYVGQNPLAGFVTERVEDELAYTMENLGVPSDAMRRRVEDTVDLLGLQDLRDRSLRALSGGQQQRVAIGAVLTASPRVLVLDEPTSALDPAAAEEVLGALARLVHDLGLTVCMAEHRLERVLPFADRMVLVPGDGAPIVVGTPQQVMRDVPVAPPIVELGRLVGWDPLPLTVRDARRQVGTLRTRIGPTNPAAAAAPLSGAPLATAHKLGVAYGAVTALAGLELELRSGEVTVLMGRNGSGKSTLLNALAGGRAPTRGSVRVEARDPYRMEPAERVGQVGLVPQDPGLLLYGESVRDECRLADRTSNLADGSTGVTLDRVLQACRWSDTLVTSPRASGWRWPSPSSWLRRPGCSCWTSPPGASIIPVRTGSSSCFDRWPMRDMPSCWPPTTSNWRRGWPTERWSWRTVRSLLTDPRTRSCATRRSSPPRCPRYWRRANGSRSTRCGRR